MAIKQNFETIYGASLKEAYHKIAGINFDYINNQITILVDVFCDECARNTNKPPIYRKKLVVEVNEELLPIRTVAYEFLKTLNDYQESSDVYE